VKLPWCLLRVPPFPQVATKVLQLISNDNSSLAQLSSLIASDQAFSAEILTIANSPLYALRTPVTSILKGIATLGLDRLRGIAVTVALRGYLGSSLQTPALRMLWRHSLACAFLSETCAADSPLSVGAAYTAGVMHDIGRVALAITHPEEYTALLQSGVASQAEALEREKELFGIDHCDLGRQLSIDWRLPSVLADVTFRHHAAKDNISGNEPLAAVSFACKAADAIGFAVAPSLACSCEELLAAFPDQQSKLSPKRLEELSGWIGTQINSIESGEDTCSISNPAIPATHGTSPAPADFV
jgi:HD-like signal output (HDOD) protein